MKDKTKKLRSQRRMEQPETQTHRSKHSQTCTPTQSMWAAAWRSLTPDINPSEVHSLSCTRPCQGRPQVLRRRQDGW